MSRKYLIGAALMLSLAGTANATSFVVTTDAVVGAVAASTDATSDISSSFRDDAASFVGSQGDIRGAKLESAFLHIRSQMPTLQASDAQLAQAILAL